MSNKIGAEMTFNTGRPYTEAGQVIQAKVVEGCDAFGDYVVHFADHSRHIYGEVRVCDFSTDSIMNAYDNGNYVNISKPTFAAV